MNWKKYGLVWSAKKILTWGRMGTLSPTPVMLEDGVIRVFCGIRDNLGVSRIGYFDVHEDDPKKVINFSKEPCLNIGIRGCFDDNGMLLGDIIKEDNLLKMYYVGFQICEKVKFLAFTGLATSSDYGKTFLRYSNSPILDRDDNALYIRAIHSIKKISKKYYRAWISEGNEWEIIDKKPYPRYNISTLISEDGINFKKNSSERILIEKENEYRVGRSRVFSFKKNKHILTFTYGTRAGKYSSGYAFSDNLINWDRKEDWNLEPGSYSFDSMHLAYPALIKTSNRKVLCFYTGNNMGSGGIGLAELLV